MKSIRVTGGNRKNNMATIKVTKKQYAGFKKREASKATRAHKARKGVKRCLEKIEDDKWRGDIRVAAGMKCEKCGSMLRVQAHHIFGRSNKAVRHYRPNGILLCAGHHKFFAHSKPYEFREWVIGLRGQEWWDDLNSKKNDRKTRYK